MTAVHIANTAVITGAGSPGGIGRAIAHAMATAGWDIAVLDIDGPNALAAADEIKAAHGTRAIGVPCDIADEASVAAAMGVIGSLPEVGALVNNAGVASATRFLELEAGEWDRLFAVNVRGAYNLTRAIAPGMAERGFGRIVFISSIAAERGGGLFGGVAYAATKAALLGFGRALGRELGPVGVTANCIAPGLIVTASSAQNLSEAREAMILANIPVGRKGATTDVADLVTFLCRPESGYITGATYDVNGGMHIH